MIVTTLIFPLLQQLHHIEQGQAGQSSPIDPPHLVGVGRGAVGPAERDVLHREIRVLNRHDGLLVFQLKMECWHLPPAQGVARVSDPDRFTLSAPQICIPSATTAGTRTRPGGCAARRRRPRQRSRRARRKPTPACSPLIFHFLLPRLDLCGKHHISYSLSLPFFYP